MPQRLAVDTVLAPPSSRSLVISFHFDGLRQPSTTSINVTEIFTSGRTTRFRETALPSLPYGQSLIMWFENWIKINFVNGCSKQWWKAKGRWRRWRDCLEAALAAAGLTFLWFKWPSWNCQPLHSGCHSQSNHKGMPFYVCRVLLFLAAVRMQLSETVAVIFSKLQSRNWVVS